MKLHFSRDSVYGPIAVLEGEENVILTSFIRTEVTRATASMWFDSLLAVCKSPKEMQFVGAGDAHILEAFDTKVVITNQYTESDNNDNSFSLEIADLIKIIYYWRAFCSNEINADEYILDFNQ
jgi:hypothetical protein